MKRRLGFLLVLLAAAPAGAQQQQQLQVQQQQQQQRAAPAPLSPTYIAGRQARLDGRLDVAEALLRKVLTTAPNDYLALYNLGLVYEARSRQQPKGPARLDLLRTGASWLEKARANLASSPNADYTIFNTLGFVYIQLGDLSTAEARLNEGLRYAPQLSDVSKGKLLGNLGYVRALRGDTSGAAKYLDSAAKIGDSNAISNLQRLKSAR